MCDHTNINSRLQLWAFSLSDPTVRMRNQNPLSLRIVVYVEWNILQNWKRSLEWLTRNKSEITEFSLTWQKDNWITHFYALNSLTHNNRTQLKVVSTPPTWFHFGWVFHSILCSVVSLSKFGRLFYVADEYMQEVEELYE